MEQDEIYLIDLWRIVTREWRWFAIVFVLVLAGALGASRLIRPQWEAMAWIRVGQLGEVVAGADPHAEPFQRTIERLQTRPFQDAVMHDLGLAPTSREAGLYRSSFKLDPSPYAGMIELTVRGFSPQQAHRFAEATFEHLRTIHDSEEAEPLQLAHARLAQAQAQLADATNERDRLRRGVTDSAVAGKGAGQQELLLASMVMAGSNQQVRALQQAVSDLKARLSASYSYQTSLVWPTYVPDRRVSTSPMLVVAVGLALALGLGMLAAIARATRRRSAARGVQPNPSRPALTV